MAVVKTLGWLTAIGLLVGLVMGFGVAPREVTQGNVQRIMYVHVPLILASYVAFGVLAVASVIYLIRRDPAADRVAHASGEVGVIFVGLGIATGSIWGKPTWGTWWTWDARLTSVAILFVMYLGYLLLRGTIDDPERAARYCAVLGIVAALDIPLVHFSVYWWRTLHQPPSLMKPGGFTGSSSILWPLLINLLAFILLYAYFVARRVRLLRAEAEAAA
jgi:heme exporter protein C